MASKKMLVAFHPARPDAVSTEFVVPPLNGGSHFVGIQSGRIHMHGRVVYTGRNVFEQDILAKLLEAGCRPADANQALARLSRFLELVRLRKIGDVVTLAGNEAAPGDLSLVPVKRSTAAGSRRLP